MCLPHNAEPSIQMPHSWSSGRCLNARVTFWSAIFTSFGSGVGGDAGLTGPQMLLPTLCIDATRSDGMSVMPQVLQVYVISFIMVVVECRVGSSLLRAGRCALRARLSFSLRS